MLHIRSLLGTICVLSIFIHKVVYLWTMQYYSIKHKYDEWRNLKKFGTWILKQIEYSEHHCVFLSLSLSTYYDFKKHTLFKSSERESKDVRKFTRNVYGGGVTFNFLKSIRKILCIYWTVVICLNFYMKSNNERGRTRKKNI